jgi:hypothetical protein
MSTTSRNDLATHCQRTNIPFRPVTSFFDVLDSVRALKENRATIGDLLWEPELGRRERDSIDAEGWTLLAGEQ